MFPSFYKVLPDNKLLYGKRNSKSHFFNKLNHILHLTLIPEKRAPKFE